MAKKSPPLTDAKIQAIKPTLRPQKISDGATRGLHLLVGISGSKTWRFRFQLQGKEHVIKLGIWNPTTPLSHMSLAGARAKSNEMIDQLQLGNNPAADLRRQDQPERITFEYAATQYLERYFAGKLSVQKPADSTQATARRAMQHCAPIHKQDLDDLKPPDYRQLIDTEVERGKGQSALKLRSFLNKVLRYAYEQGWIPDNPIPKIAPPPVAASAKMPAITDREGFGKLLNLVDAFEGHAPIKAALQIAPHVFVRPGELRMARWGEIDFDAKLWTIPADRTKLRRAHLVPLSAQVWDLFADHGLWSSVNTRPDDYVFPSRTHRDRPMSENTINYALRSLGIDTKTQHCAHGFRASASTLLNSAARNSNVIDSELIEHCLAHRDPDKIKGIYDRSELLEHRAALMQEWSDMIDRLKAGKSLTTG